MFGGTFEKFVGFLSLLWAKKGCSHLAWFLKPDGIDHRVLGSVELVQECLRVSLNATRPQQILSLNAVLTGHRYTSRVFSLPILPNVTQASCLSFRVGWDCQNKRIKRIIWIITNPKCSLLGTDQSLWSNPGPMTEEDEMEKHNQELLYVFMG